MSRVVTNRGRQRFRIAVNGESLSDDLKKKQPGSEPKDREEKQPGIEPKDPQDEEKYQPQAKEQCQQQAKT